jgi:glycosyltransferase involved in cell wall biosynthesis
MAVLFAEAANFAITLAPLNPVEIPGYERWKSFCDQNSINVMFEASDRVNYKELIAASDFCITTSIREGFGMVYMEPWLAGTPVIGREISCVIGDLKQSGLRFPRLYEKLQVETPLGKKDFKDISVDEQENVILSALKDRGIKKEIFQANAFLDTWLNRFPDDLILNNQKIIRQKFSLEEYGKQLFGFYSEISR